MCSVPVVHGVSAGVADQRSAALSAPQCPEPAPFSSTIFGAMPITFLPALGTLSGTTPLDPKRIHEHVLRGVPGVPNLLNPESPSFKPS